MSDEAVDSSAESAPGVVWPDDDLDLPNRNEAEHLAKAVAAAR